MAVDVHKALASRVRQQIMGLLEKKDAYLSELAVAVRLEPQTVLFHMNVLEQAGLIEHYFEKGKKYYRLTSRPIIAKARPGPHKPPHEIILDRIDELEEKIDALTQEIRELKKRR